MHTKTLPGIFPDPKPVYRRNFIKENARSIKQMQGLLQEAGVIQPRKPKEEKFDKFRTVPPLLKPRDIRVGLNRGDSLKKLGRTKVDSNKEKTTVIEKNDDKFTDRYVQTERADDLSKLYETGVIKYPSPGIAKLSSNKNAGSKSKNQGDGLVDEFQNLEIDEKDYIKGNMTNIKPKIPKQQTPKVLAQAPPNYQRGVVPKYIKDRKQEESVEVDEPCPPGHVLLPEEERKETLRVLRQSYADRIQELNTLPVRSDTLRIKKRKMEIEEELKTIDGGIKVFQRPKVYVKINA